MVASGSGGIRQAALHKLATVGAIHFDGGDYDLLAQMQSDVEYNLRRSAGEEPPRVADGQIDYDLVCARQISTLSHALLGMEGVDGFEGIVARETDWMRRP